MFNKKNPNQVTNDQKWRVSPPQGAYKRSYCDFKPPCLHQIVSSRCATQPIFGSFYLHQINMSLHWCVFLCPTFHFPIPCHPSTCCRCHCSVVSPCNFSRYFGRVVTSVMHTPLVFLDSWNRRIRQWGWTRGKSSEVCFVQSSEGDFGFVAPFAGRHS